MAGSLILGKQPTIGSVEDDQKEDLSYLKYSSQDHTSSTHAGVNVLRTPRGAFDQ